MFSQMRIYKIQSEITNKIHEHRTLQTDKQLHDGSLLAKAQCIGQYYTSFT